MIELRRFLKKLCFCEIKKNAVFLHRKLASLRILCFCSFISLDLTNYHWFLFWLLIKVLFPLLIQVAYERMKEAKEALSEVFKEVSRSIIQDATRKSIEFTKNKKSVKFTYYIMGYRKHGFRL